MTTGAELLEVYDAGLRIGSATPLPVGASYERDGPLHRFLGFDGGGFVVYRDLAGLDGDALDALIARQVEAFAARESRSNGSSTATICRPIWASGSGAPASSLTRPRPS